MNNMKKGIIKYTIVYSLILGFLPGCIENDIPYPYQEGRITEMEVEGLIGNVEIRNTERTVALQVDDKVDIENLQITKLKVNYDARIYPDSEKCQDASAFPEKGFASLDSVALGSNTRVNFSTPVAFLLQTYQDYNWTVSVKQIFNRQIIMSGQVGDAIFDEANKQVIVYVKEGQSLKNITVSTMQLGSSIATTLPKPTSVKDFSRPVTFNVTAFGRTEEWVVNVLYTTETITPGDISVWAKKVHVTAGREAGSTETPGFQYRKKSDSNWQNVSSSDIVVEGTKFSAWIKNLDPRTTYVYRAVIGTQTGTEQEFTTEDAPIIPNLNYDTWTLDSKGKTWFANETAEYTMWATGNEGVTMSLVNKESNSAPTDDAVKGKAARLTTIKVPIVTTAAGNLFTGTYKTDLQNPRNSAVFGQPYTGRPTRLTGYYKYQGGIIDLVAKTSENQDQLGKPDQFNIYIRLEDRSGSGEPRIIASADLRGSATVSEYTKFDLELKYLNETTKPTHIVLVSTSSLYGDDFVGHEGSVLHVDEFELGFD